MVVSQRAVGWCKAADLLQCLTPERQVNERAYGFAQRSVRQKMRRQTKLMRRIPDRYGFIFPSGYAYVKRVVPRKQISIVFVSFAIQRRIVIRDDF